MAPDTGQLVASILNAAWMVRNYRRGGPMRASSPMHRQRAAAISALGVAVRDAFEQSKDYEVLLAAICDGLRPRDDQPF